MKRNISFIFICVTFITIQGSEQTSVSHNHNQKHNEQLQRMWSLGLLFDKEVEKAKNGLIYEFTGIFKAMNRLTDNMVCPSCQITYRSIGKQNIKAVLEIQEKLKTGELPKKDLERGHYS